MPAYTTPTHTAVFIAPSPDAIPAAWTAWTGQPAPEEPWIEIPPHASLAILRRDEPHDTHEPDFPPDALRRSAGPSINTPECCLMIEATASAWAAWAGHGLLVLNTPDQPDESWCLTSL